MPDIVDKHLTKTQCLTLCNAIPDNSHVNDGNQNFIASPISTSVYESTPAAEHTPSDADLTHLDNSTSSHIKSLSNSSIFANGPWEPLSDPEDARLFQHYIDNLGPWLDLNDPQCYFTNFVPHFALRCPMLLSAILSFSASHLSRLDSSCDALTGVKHHSKCVERLIPALADPSLALDPILPLSTVILRMHEMLTYENDQQHHLRGCFSLFAYNRVNIRSHQLKGTAFWTYIREEILVALPNKTVTNIHTSRWKLGISWEGNADSIYTNKITWLAVEVINFCFGPDLKTNVARFDALHRDLDEWRHNLPDTFKPLYTISDGDGFPKIGYLCTWHSKLDCTLMGTSNVSQLLACSSTT